VRLDLGLQRFHARFQHSALELLGLGPLGGLAGRHICAALAAGHHLDDDAGHDEKEIALAVFQHAREKNQAKEEYDQQRLP
jgi:hypothetical protein